jgi:crotonobetainyl-CoA:carnitine CoA-transferase CaiB-like acyl-CoA transferase/predicted nuclease with RNAse H fold
MIQPLFLGIDLTTKEQKPTACAILDEQGALVSVTKLSTDDEMVELAETHRPTIIAIDSPLGFPEGMDCLEENHDCESIHPFKGRVGERQLIAEGIGLYVTTKRSIIKPMIYRAIELTKRFEALGCQVLEVYPFAAKVRLLGKPLPKKTTREGHKFLVDRLNEIIPGLDTHSGKLDHDHVDALFAAHTAWLHSRGRTESMGSENEVAIVVPAKRIRWPSAPVPKHEKSDGDATNFRPGALQGIKVVDWTLWQFGPVAATMMGDLGADIIKVESLDGDPGRAVFAAGGVDRSLPAGRNAYFEANHRNKRSIALDLKNPEGLEVVRKLVEDADVFIQNFRKGVAERLGLGYEDLKKINPKLIYASGSGYGPLGPDSAEPALDSAAQARSGLMFATGPDGAEPYLVQGVIGDQIGGITLGWGILAALVARNIHGVGQRVDVSHLSSSMWLQGLAVSMGSLTRNKPNSEINLSSNPPRDNAYNPLANHYKCGDGRWIMLANFQADRYWESFTDALGLGHLKDDPRFIDTPTRGENRRDLITILDDTFAQKTYDQWAEILRASGDFIFSPVQSLPELVDDPQVIANGYMAEVEHPDLGNIKLADHPIRYSKTPNRIVTVAPELGQHTEEILLSMGYTWDDITNFQDLGVIL